jgi:hypothetical protein
MNNYNNPNEHNSDVLFCAGALKNMKRNELLVLSGAGTSVKLGIQVIAATKHRVSTM